MNYFKGCNTIEEAKKRYKELLKKNHPDLGGSKETCQKIIIEFETFLKASMFHAFEKDKRSYRSDFSEFNSILQKISNFNMRIEIIGHWIYCFNSFQYKDQLKNLGFWFSKKHKAWVFSGGKKRNWKSPYTLNMIRSFYGSELIQSDNTAKQLA